MANKKNELALVGEFRIATPYEGLSEEDLAELKDRWRIWRTRAAFPAA